MLQHFAPAIADAATRSARPIARPRGWLRVTIPIESVEHAARELLRLGAEAEARTPVELRKQMRATATRLGEIYSA
jgi:predicted DNA-binding transcriptional regulator YafY